MTRKQVDCEGTLQHFQAITDSIQAAFKQSSVNPKKFQKAELVNISFLNRISNGCAASLLLYFKSSGTDSKVLIRALYEALILQAYLAMKPEKIERYTKFEQEISELRSLLVCIEYKVHDTADLISYYSLMSDEAKLLLGTKTIEDLSDKFKSYKTVSQQYRSMLTELTKNQFLFFSDPAVALTCRAAYIRYSEDSHNSLSSVHPFLVNREAERDELYEIARACQDLLLNTVLITEHMHSLVLRTHEFGLANLNFRNYLGLPVTLPN